MDFEEPDEPDTDADPYVTVMVLLGALLVGAGVVAIYLIEALRL